MSINPTEIRLAPDRTESLYFVTIDNEPMPAEDPTAANTMDFFSQPLGKEIAEFDRSLLAPSPLIAKQDKETLGQLLKDLINDSGLSNNRIASFTGFSQHDINKIKKHGTLPPFTPGKIQKLCWLFKVRYNYLPEQTLELNLADRTTLWQTVMSRALTIGIQPSDFRQAFGITFQDLWQAIMTANLPSNLASRLLAIGLRITQPKKVLPAGASQYVVVKSLQRADWLTAFLQKAIKQEKLSTLPSEADKLTALAAILVQDHKLTRPQTYYLTQNLTTSLYWTDPAIVRLALHYGVLNPTIAQMAMLMNPARAQDIVDIFVQGSPENADWPFFSAIPTQPINIPKIVAKRQAIFKELIEAAAPKTQKKGDKITIIPATDVAEHAHDVAKANGFDSQEDLRDFLRTTGGDWEQLRTAPPAHLYFLYLLGDTRSVVYALCHQGRFAVQTEAYFNSGDPLNQFLSGEWEGLARLNTPKASAPGLKTWIHLTFGSFLKGKTTTQYQMPPLPSSVKDSPFISMVDEVLLQKAVQETISLLPKPERQKLQDEEEGSPVLKRHRGRAKASGKRPAANHEVVDSDPMQEKEIDEDPRFHDLDPPEDIGDLDLAGLVKVPKKPVPSLTNGGLALAGANLQNTFSRHLPVPPSYPGQRPTKTPPPLTALQPRPLTFANKPLTPGPLWFRPSVIGKA